MRWSPEKLRWLSLSGAVLLAVVVAGFFGLARYSKGRIWRRILERNGVNLTQESNGITWSQSIGGRTVFTVHAAKSVPHGNGHWTLRDAVLILYGKDGRNDRISGQQFEYDEKAGVLSAVGEVHMDLQAPRAADANAKGGTPSAAPLTFTQVAEEPDTPGLIHVRTSGLVYVRKLGVAATKEMAEFRFGGITCTSHGAEFDSGPSVLRLLADVHMSGKLHNAPFTLAADRADLDRQAETAELRNPRMVSGQRTARAVHALVRMRKDGGLESGDADGDVQLISATERLSAPRLHAVFGMQDRLAAGGVYRRGRVHGYEQRAAGERVGADGGFDDDADRDVECGGRNRRSQCVHSPGGGLAADAGSEGDGELRSGHRGCKAGGLAWSAYDGRGRVRLECPADEARAAGRDHACDRG